MKNLFNKKKDNANALNTFKSHDDSYIFNIKTAAMNEGRKLMWVSKLPLHLTIAIASIAILGSIAISVYSNSQLDENRQKIAYLSDLRQSNEEIGKNSLQVQYGNKDAFGKLRVSQKEVDELVNVLKNGGSLSNNKSISSIDSEFAIQFNSVADDWNKSKPLLNTLLMQENSIVTLKTNLNLLKTKIPLLLESTSNFQKLIQSQNIKDLGSAQELYLLSTRINYELNNLFSTENFSIEKGTGLANDLKSLAKIIDGFKNGSSALNLQAVTDPNLVTGLLGVQRAFQPFSMLADTLPNQLVLLNNIKQTSNYITTTSKNMTNVVNQLNTEYSKKLTNLNSYNYITIGLFIIGIASLALLILYSLDKEKKVGNAAKELEKNQNNQAAVNLLLEQINPMDGGDFTRRVYVTDRFVTQIAEKIDKTREIFGNIVRKIKNTSESIEKNAANTEETSKKLLEVSNMQFTQMENSIERLRLITSEMDEVAQTTWIAQEESNESRKASQEGSNLVSQSMAKMDEIRNNIQESSKKIKKSSESAQAITEVTALIQNITKQIEVLALNAAIQAASSGESGREFTVVAQEVQRLAIDSKEATQQILELVKEVQEDIGGAVSSMERTTQEVVEGTKLTDNAGQALKKIEQLSEQAASRVAEASEKLGEKSSEMAAISLQMKELQNTTEHSKDIVGITAEQVESLKKISQELTSTVQGYKVES